MSPKQDPFPRDSLGEEDPPGVVSGTGVGSEGVAISDAGATSMIIASIDAKNFCWSSRYFDAIDLPASILGAIAVLVLPFAIVS